MTTHAENFDLMIAGQRLNLRWCAPRSTAQAPVIVLLHQGLGSITQWRDFPERLAKRCNCAVLAYDRHGHGRSAGLTGARAPDFLDREAIEILPALLDALGIRKPALYGHSDGGTIALMFAAAFPERPAAVICEAAHVWSATTLPAPDKIPRAPSASDPISQEEWVVHWRP